MDENDAIGVRLQSLSSKRGGDLIRALIEEFASLNREIAGLKRELAALTEYQASRDRWLALEAAEARIARLPRLVVIEPDQFLRPRDGFYGIEHASDGTPFRWTGPSAQFSFDLFIDRIHGAHVRLDALNCIDYEAQKNLVLMADGEPATLNVTPTGTGFTATALLSARADALGTNLVFILPAVLAPPDSTDNRALGIAFGRLTVAASNVEGDAVDQVAATTKRNPIGDDELFDIAETDELSGAVAC